VYRTACRLFSVWLFVLSISPTVGHAHAGGDAAHSHSHGAIDLDQESPDNANVFHWHMLLLGFEVHLPPGTSPNESPPCSSDAPTIDVGAVIDEATLAMPIADYGIPVAETAALETIDLSISAAAFHRPLQGLSSTELLRTSILIV